LLSASGVKMGSTLRDLNQFSTQSGFGTAGGASGANDTDVDSYISNLHSQSTLALIQEGLEQSKRDFDSFLEDNVQIEWEKQRQRIYEHFGLGRQNEEMAASQSTFGSTATRGAFGRSTRKGPGRSVGPKGASVNGASFAASTGAPIIGSVMSPYQKRSTNGDYQDKSMGSGPAGPSDRFTRDKQERFMETVKKLNETRLRENHFPILHEFAKAETAAGGENSDHFISAYKALAEITNETEETSDNPGYNNPKERCYQAEYLHEQHNSVESVRNRKRILDGSRKFLEKKFMDHVHEVLSKNPLEARPGGDPSVINKIRGFVRAKLAYKELGVEIEHLQKIGGEDDEYPWVILFYLLRAGLFHAASDYVQGNKNFFTNNDRAFTMALTCYASDPDRRLTPDLQQKVNSTHTQRARLAPSLDPYRMACYKIIGRCEMSRRNLDAIKETMDDWIWLQFNLAREGNRAEENAGEVFGLADIRQTVTEIGQRHFMNEDAESAGSYGVYFYLATLAGMFESAVNFLYQHNYVSAVHFAIALDYYGLLRVSDWNSAGMETLTHTTKQQPELNFGRVVGFYTRDFRAARPDAAAEYLVLLCLNADLPGEAGKQQAGLCHEALRELVLETREFSTLLGDVKINGHTTPGLIQERAPLIKLVDEDDLVTAITREAAKMADDNGRTNDAVLLNHLAGEYDSVVAILNRALSEALSVELGQEPLRLEPLKPRVATAEPQQAPQATSSSLSMLATDDPVDLALKVISLYDNNSLWWKKVSPQNRNTLGALYKLCQAKKVIEARAYMEALDVSPRSLPTPPLRNTKTNHLHSKSKPSASSPSPPQATSPTSACTPTPFPPTRPKSPATLATCCFGALVAARAIARCCSVARTRIRRGRRLRNSCCRRRRT
jgi:nuclear pore complex protein Nup93